MNIWILQQVFHLSFIAADGERSAAATKNQHNPRKCNIVLYVTIVFNVYSTIKSSKTAGFEARNRKRLINSYFRILPPW